MQNLVISAKTVDILEAFKQTIGITPPKPVGPTYKSASKGEIAIASMHYNHRVAAARKLMLKTIDELRGDVEAITELVDFHEFIERIPMDDTDYQTLVNLTAVPKRLSLEDAIQNVMNAHQDFAL